MSYSLLTFEVSENVAVVTLNNPPANGLSPELLQELGSVFQSLKESRSARALLIKSGCEGFFCAGADISMLTEIGDDLVDLLPKAQTIFNELELLPLPVVAAISGHALGGGLELALACDFRFMARDSGRIGLPEVRLGLIPSFGGTQRLPQIVGRARALEMMIKGLQITADDAKTIGLVHDVFSREEMDGKSMDYAIRLARQATGAIAHIKRCVITGYRDGFHEGMLTEFECFKENIRSRDAREGIGAFLSGGKPGFRGNR